MFFQPSTSVVPEPGIGTRYQTIPGRSSQTGVLRMACEQRHFGRVSDISGDFKQDLSLNIHSAAAFKKSSSATSQIQKTFKQ
ncbi:hypothetical protein TNCV_2677411 [Trichonephila clavipes]|nr:hypothetical protein TNCV_2677411 [Trichonephila clavipes]